LIQTLNGTSETKVIVQRNDTQANQFLYVNELLDLEYGVALCPGKSRIHTLYF